jgi:hypothetical protein
LRDDDTAAKAGGTRGCGATGYLRRQRRLRVEMGDGPALDPGHSHWKLRVATETLITTEGPFDEPSSAFEVMKFPLGVADMKFNFGRGAATSLVASPASLS